MSDNKNYLDKLKLLDEKPWKDGKTMGVCIAVSIADIKRIVVEFSLEAIRDKIFDQSNYEKVIAVFENKEVMNEIIIPVILKKFNEINDKSGLQTKNSSDTSYLKLLIKADDLTKDYRETILEKINNGEIKIHEE